MVMRTLIFLFVLLGFSVSSYAEPSKAVSYLMNEPMTMFEWGMYRLERSVDGLNVEEFDLINFQSWGVDYNWDRNRLVLKFAAYPKQKSLNKLPAKELCKELIWTVRWRFGVLKNDANLSNADREGTLETLGPSMFFKHTGFESKGRPDNLTEEIHNIIIIRVTIRTGKDDKAPYTSILACECPLTGKQILYDLDVADREWTFGPKEKK